MAGYGAGNFKMKSHWWNKYKHCSKCCLWVDMGEDDWDAYKGCAKQKKRDYELKECPYTEKEYKLLNK